MRGQKYRAHQKPSYESDPVLPPMQTTMPGRPGPLTSSRKYLDGRISLEVKTKDIFLDDEMPATQVVRRPHGFNRHAVRQCQCARLCTFGAMWLHGNAPTNTNECKPNETTLTLSPCIMIKIPTCSLGLWKYIQTYIS